MSRRCGLTAAVLLAVLSAEAARAASFDCARARAPDEKAICADRALNDLDVKMTVLLGLAEGFVAMGSRGEMQDEQVAWLKRRHACGGDRRCLLQSYQSRIAGLQPVLENVKSHGPF